jgi:hypothetical protein
LTTCPPATGSRAHATRGASADPWTLGYPVIAPDDEAGIAEAIEALIPQSRQPIDDVATHTEVAQRMTSAGPPARSRNRLFVRPSVDGHGSKLSS